MKQNLSSKLFAITTLLCINIYAQEQQVSSLLSNFGLGINFSEATISERAQGDLSVINNNNREAITIANPALLSDLELTSFSLSAQVLGATAQTRDAEFDSSSVTLSNIYFGVPLGKKGGLTLGLRIDSSVGFEVDNNEFYNFGNGTVNHAYLGFGYQVYKGLSIGLQLNQYFGKTEKRRADQGVQQAQVRDFDYNIKGTATKIGLQYKYNFYKTYEVYLGTYGVLGYDVRANGTFTRFLGVEGIENTFSPIVDTTVSQEVSGTEKNPFRSVIGAGVGDKDSRWFVGVSYENQGALEYTGDVFNQTLQSSSDSSSGVPFGFGSKTKISLGGYIVPKKNALKNYLNKINYRAGLKYEKTGLILNNNNVKDLGMSFGLGLPVGRNVSYINVSVEVGKLGEFSENQYEENYFNIGVNFSLSDRWFKKRVID